MRVQFISLLLVITLVYSCTSDGKRNIRAYYFPIADLEEGKVYEYQPLGEDSLGVDYWYYRSLKQDGNLYFTGNYYDASFVVKQFFREEMVANGMLLDDMYLYASDSMGQQLRVPVAIEANNAFPFEVSDSSGIFLYKIKWYQTADSTESITLIRNRRFLGDTTYLYQNKKYDAVQFEVRELLEGYTQGEGYIEPEYDGLEIYAKGIGLVYSRKNISETFKLEYELKDIYSMEELEKKFSATEKNNISPTSSVE